MNTKEYRQQRFLTADGVILSENKYNITIGLTLLWGILINVAMAFFLTPVITKLDVRLMLVMFVVSSIGCASLIMRTRRPSVSFAAFTGLACAMGMGLTFILTMYSTSTIYSAFLSTGIIVVGMMIVSMIFPAFFLSIGRTLGFALIGSLLVEFVGALLFGLSLTIIDYVMVVIFAGFVGFDWAKAQAYPRTVTNAIDSAADIYMDAVNIFIHMLSILGEKK